MGWVVDNDVVFYSVVVFWYYLEFWWEEEVWVVINLGVNGIYMEVEMVEKFVFKDGMVLCLVSFGFKI